MSHAESNGNTNFCVLMMDPDMDSKRRLGHFDTVVSPITSPVIQMLNAITMANQVILIETILERRTMSPITYLESTMEIM